MVYIILIDSHSLMGTIACSLPLCIVSSDAGFVSCAAVQNSITSSSVIVLLDSACPIPQRGSKATAYMPNSRCAAKDNDTLNASNRHPLRCQTYSERVFTEQQELGAAWLPDGEVQTTEALLLACQVKRCCHPRSEAAFRPFHAGSKVQIARFSQCRPTSSRSSQLLVSPLLMLQAEKTGHHLSQKADVLLKMTKPNMI